MIRPAAIVVNPRASEEDQAAMLALWNALTGGSAMTRAHIRTAAADETGNGYPEWLQVIHDVNAHFPGTFGKPDSIGEWWAGGTAEEYEHARVLHRGDGSVSIVSKTDKGSRMLRAAARHLNIYVA